MFLDAVERVVIRIVAIDEFGSDNHTSLFSVQNSQSARRLMNGNG
jgi:hypothetical protein